MKYQCKPVYKYLAMLFILSLFIYHQKTSLDGLKILVFAAVLTIFSVIMDYVFIDDHPGLLEDAPKKKRKHHHYDEYGYIDHHDTVERARQTYQYQYPERQPVQLQNSHYYHQNEEEYQEKPHYYDHNQVTHYEEEYGSDEEYY